MKHLLLILLVLTTTTNLKSQIMTQTVRGNVIDSDSEQALIGASILVIGSDPVLSALTDINGKFRLPEVPLGRISLRVSYAGYKTIIKENVVINSGKEAVIQVALFESVANLDEVVIKAKRETGKALNEMSIISARSISAEETNRYAGGFNDPSRITSNFAGVGSSQDGGNDIIVRGNSPKYMQWRLEGVQITNPNHFGDQSAVGGAISTLNNNLLATSDFQTGAFSAEYGDVLSGVYDVKLRAGNNEKFESVFGFGLLGTDITLEGPFAKDYDGSYLINYRYSTASVAEDLDLVDVGGIPKFQDAAFKVVLPTKKVGSFSLFGLWGLSSFLIEDVKPEVWVTPGNNGFIGTIVEDYNKRADLLNLGLNHTLFLADNCYLKTVASYSTEGIEDQIFESTIAKILNAESNELEDSVISTRLNFNNKIKKSTSRLALTLNHKFNAKDKIQVGSKFGLIDYVFNQSQLLDTTDIRVSLVDFDENFGTLRNFANWQHRFSDGLTMVVGVHNMNVLLNNKSTLEPRFALSWQVDESNSFNLGYGRHSMMESIHNYFAKVPNASGEITEPNMDLDLLKADHYVLGYKKRFGSNTALKAEVYFQDLFNIPVENEVSSNYSTINEGLDFRYVDLVNEGTGRNYGLEMTLEQSFKNNFYYMLNGSVFESKYTALDGMERNTRFSGDYLINLLAGKEYTGRGRKENQTLGINGKLFFGGGKKIIPLLRDNQGNLAVSPEENQFYDYDRAYEDKIEDIYLLVISASYKWNKPRATHELFLNIDNVTNFKGKLSEYYDEDVEGDVAHVTQFGIFPNLLYRVYF